VGRPPLQHYVTPPRELKAFPTARRTRPKARGRRRRMRWIDDQTGNLLEWDYQHGRVEMFDGRGHHIGEFDPDSGEQTKPADNNRTIEP
jgi:hypothetical protein